jgi:uncharacterized glyoxalase superfamily protein PhnB
MAGKVRAVPEGMHTLTPNIVFQDANKAIEWYKKAFGAEQRHPAMTGPDGKKVIHAEIRVGDSSIHLADEGVMGPTGPKSPKTTGAQSPVTLQLYAENIDAIWKRAVDAGAKVTMPLMDMFWGDRYGQLQDPEGYYWNLGEHKQDLTPDEIMKGQKDFFAKMGGAPGGKH